MAVGRDVGAQQVVEAGVYSVLDFRGVQGDVTYYHKESCCHVAVSSEDSHDIVLDLNPDSSRNPWISVKSQYKVVLSGVTFENQGNGQSQVRMRSVALEGARLSFLGGSLLVDAKISQEEIRKGAVTAHVEHGPDGEKHLQVKIDPENLNQGIVSKALSKLGLLKSCELMGKMKPKKPGEDKAPGARPAHS